MRDTSAAARHTAWPHAALLVGLWLALTLVQWASHVVPARLTAFRAWEYVTASDRPFRPHALWRGQTYGDLANMAGAPQLQRRHEQVFSVDEYGFRNPVGQAARRPQVVIVGDSFAAGSQLSDDEVLSRVIEDRLGVATYNYATMPLRGFAYNRRFAEQPPRVVIAFHVEREISPELFAIPADAQLFTPSAYESEAAYRRAHRRGPRQLWRERETGLARGSLVSKWAEPLRKGALWSLGLFAFPPQIAHYDPASGFLFYRESTPLEADPARRLAQLPAVFAALRVSRDVLAARGMRLIVLVAPDKETLYHDRLPQLAGRATLAYLDAFCFGLTSNGIDHVPAHRVLAAYRQAHPTDDLYFAGDTHLTALGHEVLFEALRDKLVDQPNK